MFALTPYPDGSRSPSKADCKIAQAQNRASQSALRAQACTCAGNKVDRTMGEKVCVLAGIDRVAQLLRKKNYPIARSDKVSVRRPNRRCASARIDRKIGPSLATCHSADPSGRYARRSQDYYQQDANPRANYNQMNHSHPFTLQRALVPAKAGATGREVPRHRILLQWPLGDINEFPASVVVAGCHTQWRSLRPCGAG